jgi:YgiT-type zinc finger domain-containing protein
MGGNGREEANAQDGGVGGAFACRYCNCRTCQDTVRAAFWQDERLVAIEGIPARVCEGCGEQFYDEQTTRKIEKILRDPACKPRRTVLVPVFLLEDA